MLLSDCLGISPTQLWRYGVFDSYLGIDSLLHVDPARLRTTRVPELRGSYKTFQRYFEATLHLIAAANHGDALERQAIKRLIFPEVAEASLGYTQHLKRSRSQIVILKKGRGKNIKYQPFAFTEHGILMLSSVLKSPRAVQVNIQIMRTFVRLRQMLSSSETLIERLDKLEENYDAKFKIVFSAIRQLMNPPVMHAPAVKRKPIGFRPKAGKK